MGVFLIRNVANDKVFVGVGQDLRGSMNRHRFQLTTGIHPNDRLQTDWNELGSEGFTFEVVDQIKPPDDPRFESAKELAFTEQLWLEKLKPFGSRGYNKRKPGKEEMLKRISARR
jgi:hypothetical protein